MPEGLAPQEAGAEARAEGRGQARAQTRAQAGERSALSTLVPLYFLSFPLGHAGVAVLSWLKVKLYTGSGHVLGMHEEALLLWSALTVLGLLQWFVLLPWVARWSRRLGDFLFK